MGAGQDNLFDVPTFLFQNIPWDLFNEVPLYMYSPHNLPRGLASAAEFFTSFYGLFAGSLLLWDISLDMV